MNLLLTKSEAEKTKKAISKARLSSDDCPDLFRVYNKIKNAQLDPKEVDYSNQKKPRHEIAMAIHHISVAIEGDVAVVDEFAELEKAKTWLFEALEMLNV